MVKRVTYQRIDNHDGAEYVSLLKFQNDPFLTKPGSPSHTFFPSMIQKNIVLFLHFVGKQRVLAFSVPFRGVLQRGHLAPLPKLSPRKVPPPQNRQRVPHRVGHSPRCPACPSGWDQGGASVSRCSDENVQEWNWAKETEEGLPQKLEYHYLACPCIHMSIVSLLLTIHSLMIQKKYCSFFLHIPFRGVLQRKPLPFRHD